MIFHQFSQPIQYLDYNKFQENSRKKRVESIFFLEHPATITAGINSLEKNLLATTSVLSEKKIEFLEIPRGGDYTAHELGQLVVYFHIDLEARGMKIADFLREMQENLVDSVHSIWKISLVEDRAKPGLYWEKDPSLKIVSIGVYFKRFFTSFGFAMNLSNSCETFQYINPCGMKSENIKSLKMLGAEPGLKKEFIQCYSRAWKEILEKKYPAPNSKKVRWI